MLREIWGYKENIKCERIHQRASRYYMGVHPKTSILALISDMGSPTSQIKRHGNMIRYWNRLINMNDNRLAKQIFIYDISKCNSNWSSEVKSLLNVTNYKSVFDNYTTCKYNNVYDKCVKF